MCSYCAFHYSLRLQYLPWKTKTKHVPSPGDSHRFSCSWQRLSHASPSPRRHGGETGIMLLCLRTEADDRLGPLREHKFLVYQSAYRDVVSSLSPPLPVSICSPMRRSHHRVPRRRPRLRLGHLPASVVMARTRTATSTDELPALVAGHFKLTLSSSWSSGRKSSEEPKRARAEGRAGAPGEGLARSVSGSIMPASVGLQDAYHYHTFMII